MISLQRSQPGPGSAPEPGRLEGPGLGLGRREYHPAENGSISLGAAQRIAPHGPGGVPQCGGKSDVVWVRWHPPPVIYRTTQLDNAVQDTEPPQSKGDTV